MYFNQFAVDDTLFNRGLARLAGTSSVAVTTVGVFANQFSGSCTGTVSTTASLTQQTKLAGTALCAVSTTATVQDFPYFRPYAVNGKNFNAWAFNFPNETNAAASATCVVTCSGTLKLVMDLAATSTCVVTTAAVISGTQPLAGTSNLTATTAAALQDEIRLASAITGAVTVSAALQKFLGLRGAITGLVTTTANIQRDVRPGAAAASYTPLVTTVLVASDSPFSAASANQVSVATSTTTIYANASY